MKKLPLLLTLLILTGIILSVRYEVSGQKDNSFLVDDKRLSVYITYVKKGVRKPRYSNESNQGVWLRLHNNTRWSIRFCGGAFEKENNAHAVNHNVGVLEAWKNKIKDSAIPKGYYAHVCMMQVLESGKSLDFSIPSEHLGEGLMINLPFQYEWEKVSSSEPTHLVFYYSNALPE
jgi:hypothetical protein